VEASGRRELAFEHEDWRDRLERLDPAWAKVLVRYNPDADPEMNARQRTALADLGAYCTRTDRALMLELLVPPEPAQDGPAYDADARPDLMVRAIEEIRDANVLPSVWKIEGLAEVAQCERVARAAAASCLVLGRGADRAVVDGWLRAGAAAPGYEGFAIGRSIWWDALTRFFADTSTREEAVSAIASEYARCVDVYDAAVP
jgi:myo-inositol catabolism protein IolC